MKKYSRVVFQAGGKEIYRRTPPTERRMFTTSIALSPDGQRFAFIFKEALFVVPATGGDARELLKVREPEPPRNYVNVAWTPDGRFLLYVQRGDKQSELWRVVVDGGAPQKLGQLMEGAFGLQIHSDGQRIAFAVSQPRQNEAEVWVMENFLPAAPARKISMSRR